MTKKVKTIGVIGLGSIGLRHSRNLWQRLGQTEVINYDPDPAKQNGTGWVVGNVNKLVEMSDLVVIASPTNLHADHIHECLLAEKPFFVEKPIKHLLTDREGVEAVMVGYNLRFHSCVKKAKEWMDNGLVGEPLWANFTLGQYSEKPPYLRDGVILNWSHEIDLALYLLGNGRVGSSSTRLSDGRDDLTDINFIHNSGCRTAIHLDYLTKPEIRQFIIVGTEATIIVDLVHRLAWLRDSNEIIRDQFQGQDSWDENYVEEMQAFLDRCDGKDVIGCTGTEGLKVLEICLEVRKQAGLP